MNTRRITPSWLYSRYERASWPQKIAFAMDEAAANLCRLHWQRGHVLAREPVGLARSPRRP